MKTDGTTPLLLLIPGVPFDNVLLLAPIHYGTGESPAPKNPVITRCLMTVCDRHSTERLVVLQQW